MSLQHLNRALAVAMATGRDQRGGCYKKSKQIVWIIHMWATGTTVIMATITAVTADVMISKFIIARPNEKMREKKLPLVEL